MKFIKHSIEITLGSFFVLATVIGCASTLPIEEKPAFSRVTYQYNHHSETNTLDVSTRFDPDTRLPVLIYVHGGGWYSQDKTEWSNENAAFFLNKGIMSVSINYTLAVNPHNPPYTSNKFPDMIGEVSTAMEWVYEHITELGGDTTNIFVMGYSAGSYLVNLAVLQKRTNVPIRGVISLDAGWYITMDRKLMDQSGQAYMWDNAFGLINSNKLELNPVKLAVKRAEIPKYLVVCGSDPIRVKANTDFVKQLTIVHHTAELFQVSNMEHNAFTYFGFESLEYSNKVANFIINNYTLTKDNQ